MLTRSRPRRTGALVAGAAVLLTACSGGGSPPPEAATTTPGVSVSVAPSAPAAPTVGSCHALDLDQATQPVDPTRPVPCARPHTSVTVAVGQIAPLADGHLLAVDSAAVRAQIAAACPATLAGFVGGTRTTQRLSRLQVVWFSPSLQQADAGANWYRCDVVGLRDQGRLLELPRRMKGALDAPGALDRFGTCGTSAPGRKGFERVACSERHSWRAVAVVEIDPRSRYLAKSAAAAGDARCKDVAADRAGSSLKFTWSFEWPTKGQWRSGQRYGYCWVPQG